MKFHQLMLSEQTPPFRDVSIHKKVHMEAPFPAMPGNVNVIGLNDESVSVALSRVYTRYE